jgi:hypothetical protein
MISLLLVSRLSQLVGHLCLYYTLESAATVNRNETNLLYYHLGLLNNTRTHAGPMSSPRNDETERASTLGLVDVFASQH